MKNRIVQSIIKEHKLSLFIYCLVVAMPTVFQLLSSVAIQDLIDTGLSLQNRQNFFATLSHLALLYFACLISGLISSIYNLNLYTTLTTHFKNYIYKNLWKTHFSFYQDSKSGMIANSLEQEPEYALGLFIQVLPTILINIVTLTFGTYLLFQLNNNLTLLLIVYLPFIFLSYQLSSYFVKKYHDQYMFLVSDKVQLIYKFFNYEAQIQIRTQILNLFIDSKLSKIDRDLNHRLYLKNIMPSVLNQGAIAIQFVILYFVYRIYGLQIIEEKMTIGQMMAFAGVLTMVMQQLNSLSSIPVIYSAAISSFDRVEQLCQEMSNDKDERKSIKFIQSQKPVIFEISKYVLPNKFTIPDKILIQETEKIALIGKSGSGKTTLIQTLLGIKKDYIGSLKYRGVEINKIDLNEIYHEIYYVQQNSCFLFNTIRLQLDPLSNFSNEQILNALDILELNHLIPRIDDQMDLENGLSGGEKQRLALAQVLLMNPRVLVLDEATSAVDEITALKIINHLLQVLKNSTIITITHRKSEAELFQKKINLDFE